MTPSPSLLANLRVELMRRPPFSGMQEEHIEALLLKGSQAYYAPGETILSPASGPVDGLYCIRSGSVTHRPPQGQGGDFEFEAGELFPLGAMMAARAVTGTYTAHQDVFLLRFDADTVRAVAAQSPPLADYLRRSILTLLEASQRMLREGQASQALAEQSLESPLGDLLRNQPVTVPPRTSVGEALQLMHQRSVGSIPVVDDAGRVLGILTRHDVLGRIALPRLPLETPIDAVMTSPVRTLGVADSAMDAALLMSQHGIRHVPVTDGGRLVGIVSERDLFAIQRLSLKQLGTAIRSASGLDSLKRAADDIRSLAGTLLSQGVQARQLTRLISRLNDALTIRLVESVAADRGIDMRRFCWLAAGSEGREEQTVATDQDNGLLFESADPAADRARWLAFGSEINHALDACGFPLCRGNVMASNPQWCLSVQEWGERFSYWIARGEPQDLLNASIWFDFRPTAGQHGLAAGLRPLITEQVALHPRFLRLLAANCLNHKVPLDWLGGIETSRQHGRNVLDIKLNGTMIYVDAARLYALAKGVDSANTRARFEAVARAMRVPAREGEGWVGGFEYLQMLRLRRQIEAGEGGSGGVGGVGGSGGSGGRFANAGPGADEAARGAGPAAHPQANLLDVDSLSDIDRRILKESLRIARRLQQRIELDFPQ